MRTCILMSDGSSLISYAVLIVLTFWCSKPRGNKGKTGQRVNAYTWVPDRSLSLLFFVLPFILEFRKEKDKRGGAFSCYPFIFSTDSAFIDSRKQWKKGHVLAYTCK